MFTVPWVSCEIAGSIYEGHATGLFGHLKRNLCRFYRYLGEYDSAAKFITAPAAFDVPLRTAPYAVKSLSGCKTSIH